MKVLIIVLVILAAFEKPRHVFDRKILTDLARAKHTKLP